MPPAQKSVSAKKALQGTRLTPRQMEMIKPFHPHLFDGANRKPVVSKPRISRLSQKTDGVRRVNPSGSSLQGYRTVFPYRDINNGWYELNIDGSQDFLWEYNDPEWTPDSYEDKPDFPFQTAFVRNGKLYGFHSEALLFWLIWGHGCFTFDGEITDWVVFGNELDITDFSTYVLTCVYYPERDIVYAYTLNSDGTAYQLQTINPDTWEFTPLRTNVPIEDILIGITYNPADGKIYGITPDSRFCNLDTAGNLTQLAKFDLPVVTMLQGMTYSPLDKMIYFVFCDGENDAILYSIDPASPQLVQCAVLPGVAQYRILATPDQIVADNAPKAPQLISFDFPEGSLSGTATVKAPEVSFSGQPLSGTLTMRALVDGTEHFSTQCLPGETVTCAFTDLDEGVRRFNFYAEWDGVKGIESSSKMFVGFGIPMTPENIQFESGKVSWSPVTGTVDGGYLDTELLSYNVYLNGSRINDTPVMDTEFSFSMPDEEYRSYTAQVEAVNHGHVSDRGYSNEIMHGAAIALPVHFTPSQADASLFSVSSQRESSNAAAALSWRAYFSSSDVDGYFQCSTLTWDESLDEWLFSPPLIAASADCLIEVSFEAMAVEYYDDTKENIAVGWGQTPEREAMTVAKKWSEIPIGEWTTFTHWIYPGEGNFHVGLLTTTGEEAYQIRVRNLKASVSQRAKGIPSAVTEAVASADPAGALKATVTFNMPATAADGSPLPNGTLTATIKSKVGEVSVSDAPGAKVSAVIETLQGWNDLTITAVNDAGDGLETQVRVFTGQDMPGVISSVTVTHPENYGTLHIAWEPPVAGANGGYFNPDEVTYHLWSFDYDNWVWVEEKALKGVTECDFTPQSSSESIELAALAISAENEQGHNEYILEFNAPYGTPFSMPVTSDFDNYEIPEPYMSEFPDDTYTEEFGFSLTAYPYWVEIPAPYGQGAFVAQGAEGAKARIVLPAFSTAGVGNAWFDAPFYIGRGKPEYVIYAESYGIPAEEIGRVGSSGETEFKRTRIMLPQKFIGKSWVILKIDAVFSSNEPEVAAIGQFCIRDYKTNDFAMTKVNVDPFLYVNKAVTLSAVLENNGSMTALAPEVEVEIKSNGKSQVLDMSCENGQSPIEVLEQILYTVEWTPGSDDMGDLQITLRMKQSDMDESNNSMTTTAQVAAGKTPVVTDLKAEAADGNVILTWTDPDVQNGKESFESYVDFSYGAAIGDFKTVRLDEHDSGLPLVFPMPYMDEGKAWQVINIDEIDRICEENGMENLWFSAATGKKCLMATVPSSLIVGEGLISDRWLITPELKPGSTVKFSICSGEAGLEVLDVLYSSESDDPADFVKIETLRLLSTGWRNCEYTIPSDARYLALRYRSNTDEGTFILADDFEYEPAEEGPVLKGYDIFRSGAMVSESANVFSQWIDHPEAINDGMYYHIIPVLTRGGSEERGIISNRADVALSGIEAPLAETADVVGTVGHIVATGLQGVTIDILNTQGIRITSLDCASNDCIFPMSPGIYIVSFNGTNIKILVR